MRRDDAGEPILDNLDAEEASEPNDDSIEAKIEALTEIVCRACDEPGTGAAALLVLVSTIENSSHPKAVANTATHLAFTRCGVATKVLNQAVKRNLDRFPEDFMFQLTKDEAEELQSRKRLRSQIVTLKKARGTHRKYQPYAFTEHGILMLSSVLKSPRAVQVNIQIMRTFVRLRQMLASNGTLVERLNELEERYDAKFRIVFHAIRQLMNPQAVKRKPIGFHPKADRR